ncbi:hypothetical protein BC834DRAFT_846622 [Gloeopeniophorella convolvens]|nr:hypothetical protein BC834DRAFT_846622 [Gloeopeniophorella convolvens]
MPQIIELGPLPDSRNPGYPTEATAYGPTAPTRAESDFTDGSGAIFSFYLERAEQEDNEMTESWRGDADGILVFTGLFSATVATFLVVSLQSLTQNSQDTSAFYLARLYQLSAANGPNGSVPIPLPSLSDPSSFSPSASAVWVNILWFLSLVISLTCALLATLLQQWARRYLRLARLPRALDKRARIRSFIREGVDKFYLPSVVEALPGLLHVSVFLFFAGLAIFLSGINSIVFKAILSSISVSAGMYLCATLMPLFRHDSPYHTSLSTLFWFLGVGVQQTVLSILNSVYKRVHRVEGPQGWSAFDRWRDRVTRRSRRGMVSEVERIATGWWLWHVHARAIQVFIQTLDEDHEIERLVAGIPGLFNSRVIPDLSKEALMEEIVSAGTLGNTIIGFMRRSLLSNNISEYTRLRRNALADLIQGGPLSWHNILVSPSPFSTVTSRTATV